MTQNQKFKSLIISILVMTAYGFIAAAETPQEVGTFESTVDEVLRSKEIQHRDVVYSFGFQSSFGTIDTGAANISNLPSPAGNASSANEAHFATLSPQFSAEVSSAMISSAYVVMPLYWDSSNDNSSSRTLGRPEIGASKVLLEQPGMTCELGLALKLPIYEDSSGYFNDANRVFQLAPSLTTDFRLAQTRFHFVTASRLSYDTKAQVALPLSPEGDLKQIGLERPLTMRLSLGLEFDERFFSIGAGLRSVNWLGVGRVTDGAAVLREVTPVDLLLAEVTGSFQLRRETKLNLSLTQGLKTHSDFYALVQQDTPDEIAASTLSLGLVQNF